MYEYKAEVLKVVDGDTIDVIIDLGFSIKTEQRLRLRGIDVYETRLGVKTSEEEKQLGLEAKEFVENLFAENKDVIVRTEKTDKYGRYVADVTFGEYDLRELLIEKGYEKSV